MNIRSKFFILGAVAIAVTALCYTPKKSGFSVKKLSLNVGDHPEWEITPEKKDLELFNQLLLQKFTYLDRGSQSFAFVSADQKYVIKFFNMKHLTPKTVLKLVPFQFSYKTRKLDNRQKRLEETFSTIKSAYEELKEETGLLFVHLNNSKELHQKITLVDRQGKEWLVDLNKTAFIVQEKAQVFLKHFHELIQKKDFEGLERAEQLILDLIGRRCQKGFLDNDKGVIKNFGFVGNRAIQIDIGELVKDEKIKTNASFEIKRVQNKINSWIERSYPDFKPITDEELDDGRQELPL